MSFETVDFDSAISVPEVGGESIISEGFSALASATAEFTQSGMVNEQVAIQTHTPSERGIHGTVPLGGSKRKL